MITVVERVLSDSLRAGVSAEAWAWLAGALARPAGSPQPLLDAYARAPLTVGRAPLSLDAASLGRLREAAPGIGFERWTQDDAARALLLMARRAQGRTGQPFVDEALACFEHGDAREQQSWLRAIALWPEGAAFLPSAIDACRTNIVPVFEALACENPYPAAHFPDRNLNQVVLKAMFNGIALARIAGLGRRLNAELSRMARDYAAERTAAGRPVPADIGLAIHDGA
jgi:hypothetical protein